MPDGACRGVPGVSGVSGRCAGVKGRQRHIGVEWTYSDSTTFYIQTNPEPLTQAHLLVGDHDPARIVDLVSLVGQSRIGVYRDGRVHFPLRAGVPNRLIELFLPGEKPRLPKTTSIA